MSAVSEDPGEGRGRETRESGPAQKKSGPVSLRVVSVL